MSFDVQGQHAENYLDFLLAPPRIGFMYVSLGYILKQTVGTQEQDFCSFRIERVTQSRRHWKWQG